MYNVCTDGVTVYTWHANHLLFKIKIKVKKDTNPKKMKKKTLRPVTLTLGNMT